MHGISSFFSRPSSWSKLTPASRMAPQLISLLRPPSRPTQHLPCTNLMPTSSQLLNYPEPTRQLPCTSSKPTSDQNSTLDQPSIYSTQAQHPPCTNLKPAFDQLFTSPTQAQQLRPALNLLYLIPTQHLPCATPAGSCQDLQRASGLVPEATPADAGRGWQGTLRSSLVKVLLKGSTYMHGCRHTCIRIHAHIFIDICT